MLASPACPVAERADGPHPGTCRKSSRPHQGVVRALETAWIHKTWGGPEQLAASGRGWGAFHRGRALSLACTYFLGSGYEDVAALADPGHRRQHLALACVTALCEDIAARGRTPSWTCSRDNRPSRLLAWSAGFRLTREYVHHATGPARRQILRRQAEAA
ncbi:GNAT family N-acetyltransferase [Streptomyces sp. NPDC091371]|uniref:GNAT family N-acetyltransferase n=1 Tax=Streptomyces sp. NPDC091371 TaxID=3155303 RepID=UPI00343BD8EF